MADTPTVRVENNGYRNVVLRVSVVSDGSGFTGYKIYDATSGGNYGVVKGGQTFYPGLHTTIVGLDYDVQDMKLRLQWDASSPEDILPLGAAPQDFDWTSFGGIRVPSGLAGATGSILLTTLNASVNSTFSLVLRLRKNVP